MSDERKRIEGNTLSDEWEANPEPPAKYGQPDPRIILETIGSATFVWSTVNAKETITYYGDFVSIRDNELESRPSDE